MQPTTLVLRGLTYYRRTNAAVVVGVGAAVAVLAGALLVGDSVRGSLRDLVLQRLGRTDQVVVSSAFFREQLAEDLRADPAFRALFSEICPIVATQALVGEQSGGRLAGRVLVYGVDDRFWQFHGVAGVGGPSDRDALISPALARQIGAQAGAQILVRLQRPSEIPLESLHGRKEDIGRSLRLNVRAVVPSSALGEFSLQPQQGDVRAVFVSLKRLQQDLDIAGRVNTLLVQEKVQGVQGVRPRRDAELARLVKAKASLADVGLKMRALQRPSVVVVEADAGVLDDVRVEVVERALAGTRMQPTPVFTYLANSMRSGTREVPYSLVAAIDLSTIAPAVTAASHSSPWPIVLNDWTARDLQARIGDPLTMEYFVWEDPGSLLTRTAEFRVAGVVPIDAGDRDLAPAYPGITDSPTLNNWDPPFPVDLRRIRPVDEEYWQRHRTTPKAFVPLEIGQRLWRSRHGAMTSVRIVPAPGQSLEDARQQYMERLQAAIDPLAMGLAVRDVRTEGLGASRGATDFGQYFVYFSFFLVVSALLLASLFFRLGVEQRAREVGLLRAVGFRTAVVRRLFTGEAVVVALAGSAVGVPGAIGYGWLMMAGLRTWWVDAVGTTALTLHLSLQSLLAGAVGGLTAATVCIWWTLRGLARLSERSLLAGQLASDIPSARARRSWVRSPLAAATAFGLVGAALVALTAAGRMEATGGFFGAGTALLASSLFLFAFLFGRTPRRALSGRGWGPLSRLGLRHATHRPGRSTLSIAVIASATFVLISVDAFRRDDRMPSTNRHSGTGGYALLVESLLPIVHDPNTAEGRSALNLSDLEGATIEPFRVLPGDDVSCLNLYEPGNPRILGVRDRFIEQGRFTFLDSLAATDAERANPWLLLRRAEQDNAVPVVVDANSMTYVLHRKLGDEIVVTRGDRPVRLRIVAALQDSIFQGELLMSQVHLLDLFPEQAGYQFLLVDTAPASVPVVAAAIEEGLGDLGAVATLAADRLTEFHKVENTYLSTFQTLGGLGMLLGTVGLATVLLRNVLERRRELALLGAVGYRRSHFLVMLVAENALLVAGGLAAGTLCALVAIVPAAAEHGGQVPLTTGGLLLLFGVLVTGLLSSALALRAAVRGPLLEALRAE